MTREIVPTILVKSEAEFHEKLRAVERVASLVHLDVMDGKFVPNTTWADPLVVARIDTPTQFEVHLMVGEPFREVILWGKLKSVQRIIVHVESTRQLRELLHTIRATGKEVGIAVNPGTKISDLKFSAKGGSALGGEISDSIDFLLVMANDPGFSGRPFRHATLKRIAVLRRRFPTLPIGVDIGVNAATIAAIREAGATSACAGSAIFGASDPVAAYRALQRAFLSPPSLRGPSHDPKQSRPPRDRHARSGTTVPRSR